MEEEIDLGKCRRTLNL